MAKTFIVLGFLWGGVVTLAMKPYDCNEHFTKLPQIERQLISSEMELPQDGNIFSIIAEKELSGGDLFVVTSPDQKLYVKLELENQVWKPTRSELELKRRMTEWLEKLNGMSHEELAKKLKITEECNGKLLERVKQLFLRDVYKKDFEWKR